MCNIRDMNNSAKQEDIVYWHKDINNLISIFTETKLKRKIYINSGYLGLDIAVVMNISVVRHVYKVSEVLSQLFSIKLLFKNKLSVLILGLYTGASSVIWFSQTDNINSLIVKAVNEFFFVIFSSDFNKDGSCRCASFKKCLNLELVNSLINEFVISIKFSDLDAMWNVIHKVMVLLANEESLRFYKLKLLVSRIVKAFCKESIVNFDSLMRYWISLDNVKALFIQDVVDSNAGSNHVCSAFFGVRRFYCASKPAESLRAKEMNIKTAIDKRIESFEVNKGHTIRSVLKCLFYKMVFNYLVFDNILILEPSLVKFKVDVIMEGWTKKCWMDSPRYALMLLNSCLSGESKSVLMNTQFIALIETACKIFSKILSNRISLAYSTFDVFHWNNFSVLKGIMTQFSIFTISLVIENALEKNQKLWLVLQNMQKAYNLDYTNCIITDFGLTNGYQVHDGLDQKEAGLSSFFAVGTFVDNTIWSESYWYLGIFFLTEGLLKPSLAKTNSDICFFTNLVLRKAVLDKQFLYLVWVVLHSIVSYRIQFSFVLIDVCNNKVASLVNFANSNDILDCLFFHRFHNLQVLYWYLVYLLSFPVCIHVNALNNFLVDMKRLNPHSLVLEWFELSIVFLNGMSFFSTIFLVLSGVGSLNILESNDFMSVCDHFLCTDTSNLLVYMDRFLSNLNTVSCRVSTTVFFKNINLGLGVGVSDLMSSTLVELQTIALALECVPLSSSIQLFSDSQFVLDAYKSELDLCWVKHHHIVNVICSKNLEISWHKIKDYSDISGNECTDIIAGAAFLSVDGNIVSGNSRHFVYNIYYSVCHTCWKIGFGSKFLADNLLSEKCLYNRLYLSVLCLYCDNVEVSVHVFSCKVDESVRCQLLESYRTSTNNTHPKVAEPENIEANHLGFAKSLFQQYNQQLGLNSNHFPAESDFNFYEEQLTLKQQEKTFTQNYSNTPTYQGTIILYIQQQFLITYADKGKGRLQIQAITLKGIQLPTWKKQRIEFPPYPLYHHTPGSTINITSAGVSTSNTASSFRQFLFQNHMANILRDLNHDCPCHQDSGQHHLNQTSEQQVLIVIDQPPINPIAESIQQPLQLPSQQLVQQQSLQQPPQQPNLDPMAYALITKLNNFTSKEDDTQLWLNDMEKTIAANR
ncbi:hypothetical protein G9A89_007829 [Geosiphon pyriformis]|nr:hypothetical protein G9A89_007829 [Geosiphon pyriformis]